MRELKVQAGSLDNGVVDVEWRLDDSATKGIVRVTGITELADAHVIAELCALRYLVCERTIFGNSIAPRGSRIEVSAGAIKKLWRMDTAKDHIVPYGRFLYPTFEDCSFEVKKNALLQSLPLREIPASAKGIQPIETIEATYSNWIEVPCAALGNEPVGITRHALERYQERFNVKFVKTAIQSIKRLLASPTVCEISKGDLAQASSQIKSRKNGRYFLNTSAKILFVCVPEGSKWVIATAYGEPQYNNLKQAVYVGGRVEMRFKR